MVKCLSVVSAVNEIAAVAAVPILFFFNGCVIFLKGNLNFHNNLPIAMLKFDSIVSLMSSKYSRVKKLKCINCMLPRL